MNKVDKLKTHVQSLALTGNIPALAFDFFSRQLRPDLTVERTRRINQMAEEATWFYCLAMIGPKTSKNLGFATTEGFHNAAIQALNEEALRGGWHSFKCCTLKSLTKKLTPFKKAYKGISSMDDAFSTLLDGRLGNENRSVLGIIQKIRIIQIHRNPEPNYKKTYRLYTKEAEELVKLGYWKEAESIASLTAVKNFLKKPEVLRLLDPGTKLSIKNIF